MQFNSDDLRDLREFFDKYLHQDWDLNGGTLEDIFDNNEGFSNASEGIKQGSLTLINSDLKNEQLDLIFSGDWTAGYEPEHGGFEDWWSTLRELVRLCDKHLAMEK